MFFLSRIRRLFATVVLTAGLAASSIPLAMAQTSLIFSSTRGVFVNEALGWNDFFINGYGGAGTVIGNVEGGHIWFGHEVFVRPPDQPAVFLTFSNTASGGVDEIDYHATAVGNALAGSGYVAGSYPNSSFTYVGLGMAPYAEVWSGAIATSFSATNFGSFETTPASTLAPYKAFFNGINFSGTVRKTDVINSSWGGSDPAATSPEILGIDGLARQNSTVAFVVSAGNSGTATVGAPGSAYNNITVGSLGGASYLNPSDFSSRGLADFFNPETHITITGARVAVDIAAPGEQLSLAAYLGDSGSLGASTDPQLSGLVQEPSPATLYFTSLDGTSFSSPIVAGAVSLLKDVAKTHPTLNLNADPDALDTRVVKSVLMAGAKKTVGWNNGQAANQSGTLITTQALDTATGAGSLDLNGAKEAFFLGTTDVTGSRGGTLLADGWDFGTVALGQRNDYVFLNDFSENIELAISLNWFANRSFNDTTDIGSDLSFSNLNLELWQVTNGVFVTMVAQSATIYNNTEFLRLELPDAGKYGLRITFTGLVYDQTDAVASESYGVAWRSQTVPEPRAILLVAVTGLALLARTRFRRSRADAKNSFS